ncbi:MAG: tetratricopeptide repeat protein [Hyphomicrobiales bacterium]|nr:tetratricopeptide repeat protein [Hyphomicrobiales bacterium]
MPRDRSPAFGQTGKPAARAACARAEAAFLRHYAGAQDHLAEALRIDPDLAAAHVLSGLMHILMARADTLQLARRSALRAREILERDDVPVARMPTLIALEAACDGRWLEAATCLEQAIDPAAPYAVLVKVAHILRFMCGDATGMLSFTHAIEKLARSDLSGFGFILGCHAFSLEENGMLDEAEKTAQLALHREPEDIWAMHALAHVYDVSGRTGEGLLWVESGRQHWSGCNNFASHMCWHLALFCLDRGKADKALAIYDNDLSASLTDDYRDFANAVSLLRRLEQMGVDVGQRMEALYDQARLRASDTTCVFAALHNLLPLLAQPDGTSADELVSSLEALAAGGAGDQALVARDIGAPLARMLVAARQKTHREGLVELAEKLPGLGGSCVQRDLFLRSLILLADDVCDHKTTNALLAMRSRMRQADAFARMMDERICFGGSGGAQHVA